MDKRARGLFHRSIVKRSKGRHHMSVDPTLRKLNEFYDKYMIVVAVFGSIFIYLQAITIFQNKSSENISLPSYIVFLIVSLSWLVYGRLWNDWIVIMSGFIASIGAILAIVATLSYRPVSNPGAFIAV